MKKRIKGWVNSAEFTQGQRFYGPGVWPVQYHDFGTRLRVDEKYEKNVLNVFIRKKTYKTSCFTN